MYMCIQCPKQKETLNQNETLNLYQMLFVLVLFNMATFTMSAFTLWRVTCVERKLHVVTAKFEELIGLISDIRDAIVSHLRKPPKQIVSAHQVMFHPEASGLQ